MAADDPTILPAFQSICVGSDLDRSADGTGIDRVTVLVEAHEAGLGHRCRHRVESVERADIGHQARALFLEHLPDRLVPHLRMRVCPSIGQASVLEPGVQLGIGLELRTRHEEPPPHHAHLVLDLTLLPVRRRGAGNRIDEIMPAHLLEAAVIGAILADKDRIHRRLHIVVDAPGTGAAEESERLVMGVEHHLLRLTRIGSHERHPAVAQANMGDLHGRGHAIDQNDLMAPIELIGLTRIEAQRNIGAADASCVAFDQLAA